ncbi:non-ribosomal peptide synthase [Fusarium sp. MPI-SDFR-AT-0072]|nr:non-ribosomal peptide synthase [Fusarium sp. MPI-SDFR-AT-0072]
MSLPQLFRNSTLGLLAASIQGSGLGETARIDWEKETEPSKLSLPLPEAKNQPRIPRPRRGLSIILTGASGFLGSAILQQLVADPNIKRIHCLAVRDPSHLPADLDPSRVIIHRGDLTQPLLGLPDSGTAAQIFAEADAVVHNGAEVSHLKSYGSLRAANVESTRELARLLLANCDMNLGVPDIHFVSTTGVAALANSETLPMAKLPSHAVPPTDGSLGYIGSKWASERLLEKLSARVGGLRVFIHRPSNITGNGVGNQDIVHNLLRYSKTLRIVPDLGDHSAALDFIGVDTVARTIIEDVWRSPSSDGVTYRHEAGETIVQSNDLREYLGHSDSDPFQVLPMKAWVSAATSAGMDELVASVLLN